MHTSLTGNTEKKKYHLLRDFSWVAIRRHKKCCPLKPSCIRNGDPGWQPMRVWESLPQTWVLPAAAGPCRPLASPHSPCIARRSSRMMCITCLGNYKCYQSKRWGVFLCYHQTKSRCTSSQKLVYQTLNHLYLKRLFYSEISKCIFQISLEFLC